MIEAVLRRYPADCQAVRVEALGSAGGMSGAQFWRVAAPRGLLVVRRWPVEHPTPERLQFIHAVLQHAARRGIAFIPVPIATREGATFVEHAGHLWELAPWLIGAADYELAPSEAKLGAAMRALGQFHLATCDFRSSGTLPPRRPHAVARHLARLHDMAGSGAAEMSRAIEAAGADLAAHARQYIAALPGAIPRAAAQLEPLAGLALPVQPCVCDVWHDHVLFSGDAVTGLIDFGAVDIDTPATDVARLLGSLVGEDARGWQSGLAAYGAVRPLSEDELRAARALHASGAILAGGNWIRWLAVENRQFERRQQVLDRFRVLVARVGAIARG